MTDSKLRKAIDNYATEHELTVKLFDNQAYDESIVGITDSGRLVYDYSLMVEELAKEDGFDLESAVEWIDYNTLRALPYFGDEAPIILMHNKDELMDLYGEE